MLPYDQNYYRLESILNRNSLAPEPRWMKTTGTVAGDSSSRPGSKSQKEKSEEASKKHAISEQQRRWRINSHIKTLRGLLIPNTSTKTVKASILTETVRRVKELRKRADVALQQDGEGWYGGGAVSWSFMFPGESDEATVSYFKGGGEGEMVVKAIVCCEDRPGLNRDLTEAIRSVGARAVRAEMATVGGRTKVEVVVQWREEGGSGGGGEEDVGSLRRALKALVESRSSGCPSLGRLVNFNRNNGLALENSPNMQAGIGGSLNNNREWQKLLLRSV